MRNLKRVLTLVMAVAMLMSLMVVGAGATAFPDDKDIKNTEAVQKMVSLNIIQGDEKGNFNPTGIVTRAEMSKMIATAMNGGVDPKLSSSSVVTASFTDTKGHWAEGYIEYCVNLGLVAGMGDDTFAPNQGVTATHAAKMTLVALGYDADFEKFVGTTWALNINKIAMQKGLYEDIQGIDPNAPMSRDNAAQMLSNFCSTLMVKYDFGFTGNTSGSVAGVKQAYDTTDTVLSKYFKLVPTTGTIANIGYDTKKKEFLYSVKGNNFASAEDFTALMGANVEVLWRNKDNSADAAKNPTYSASSDSVYDITLKNAKIMATGNMTDFGKYDTAKKTLVFAGTTYDVVNDTVKAASAMDGSDYGVLAAFPTNATGGLTVQGVATKNTNPYLVTLLDNNDDGKLDKIVATPFTVQKVSYAGTSNSTFLQQGTHIAGTPAVGSIENADVTLYEGMKKDDIVAYYNASSVAEGKAKAVKMEIKTGTVNATRTGEVQIDGAWYDLVSATTPKAGDKIDYAGVGSNIYFTKVTDAAATSKNVLVVYDAGDKTDNFGGSSLAAKVMLGDGTKKTNAVIAKVDGKAINNLADSDCPWTTAGGLLDANKLGMMYSYKVNSDGEYELTTLQDTDTASTNTAGHDYVVETGAGSYNNKSVSVTMNASYELADNAVVIWVNTKPATPEVKMYNGKELKNNLGTASRAFNQVTILADKTNGFTSATVVAVNDNTGFPILTTGSNYGYLLSNPSMSVDSKGDNFHNYTLWTNKGKVELKEKNTSSGSSFAKGDVLAYDNDGEGLIKNVISAPGVTGAVTGWDENKKISISTLTGNSEVSKDDTTVLYIDSKKFEGYENGAITEAEPKTTGGYYDNVFYIGNTTVLDLLVVDVSNRINPMETVMHPSSVPDATALNALLARTDDIVINGDWALTADAAASIAAGKMVTVKGDLTITGVAPLSVAGKLNVTGTITTAAVITGTGTVTAGSITTADYADVQTDNVIITGDLATATTLLAKNYTFKGTVTGVITGVVGAKVSVEKTIAQANLNGTIYSTTGTADPDTTNSTTNGTAAKVLTTDPVPAGTYVYGQHGYTALNGETAPATTGWFAFPLVP